MPIARCSGSICHPSLPPSPPPATCWALRVLPKPFGVCRPCAISFYRPPSITLPPTLIAKLIAFPTFARSAEAQVALSAAFGFGGHNTILIFKKWVS